MVENLPANAGDSDLIPGLGRSPGEGNATHSSILAWKIPWTEEPGGCEELDATARTDMVVSEIKLATDICKTN